MTYDLFSQPSFEQVTVVASDSPINPLRLAKQNYRLLMWLLEGKAIHCFHEAVRTRRMGVLHSRISDLRNKHKIDIVGVSHKTTDADGETVHCQLYRMTYEEIARVKREFKIETK